jgi:hypothetical protein
MRTKNELLDNLRDMMRDLFVARASGEVYPRLARAHGYVDGYMRVLLDTGMATKKELLDLVSQERERTSGPAMRTIDDVERVETQAA